VLGCSPFSAADCLSRSKFSESNPSYLSPTVPRMEVDNEIYDGRYQTARKGRQQSLSLLYQQCSAARYGFCILHYLLSFCSCVQTKPSFITRELLDHVPETGHNHVPVKATSFSTLCCSGSQGSVIDIEARYGLDGARISLQLGKVFCAIPTVPKTYLASGTMDTGSFLG